MLLDYAVRQLLKDEYARILAEQDNAWLHDVFERYRESQPKIYDEIIRYMKSAKIDVRSAFAREHKEFPAALIDTSKMSMNIKAESIGDSEDFGRFRADTGREYHVFLIEIKSLDIYIFTRNEDHTQYLQYATWLLLLGNRINLARNGYQQFEAQTRPDKHYWPQMKAIGQIITCSALCEVSCAVRERMAPIDEVTSSGRCYACSESTVGDASEFFITGEIRKRSWR